MAPQKSLLPLLAALPYASAWGSLGHTTVTFIAQNFVSDKTAKFAQSVLNDTSSEYLANVATWADSYRYTPEGGFSSVYHYIDAFDAPPRQCNVIYERDCPEEGCIVSAIANYSVRAVQPSVGIEEQQKALKWVAHFIGDLHQPLHLENLAVGGNQINVTFDGVKTNLHSIWDTAIPQQAEGNFSIANARRWANELSADIKHGVYKKDSKTWLKGLDVKKPIDTTMLWANEGNNYICTHVVPNGPDVLFNKELNGTYYEKAIPVVTKQIAKAGYRLAAFLDAMVEEASKRGPGNGNGNGKGNGHGNGNGRGDKNDKRAEFVLEPWMEEARQVRRDFGGDCGCTAEEHSH